MKIADIQKAIDGAAFVKEPLPKIKLTDKTRWKITSPDLETSDGLTFQYLGAGTNKLVCRIIKNGTPTDWALAFQANECPANPATALADFKGEIDVLRLLGDPPKDWLVEPVTVPKPFRKDDKHSDHIFKLKIDCPNGGSYDNIINAFIIEYFDLNANFVEMDKTDDVNVFMTNRVLALPTAQEQNQKQKTKEAVQRILEMFKKYPWNDFQVLYEKSTGDVIVFDPMPFNEKTDMANKAKVLSALNRWLHDLNA